MTDETVSLESIEPKPQKLVLAQYMERKHRGIPAVPYWDSPSHQNRWLVRLDCGCITEVITHKDHDAPSEEHDYQHSFGPDDGPVFKRTFVGHPRSLKGHCILGDTMDPTESRKVNPFPGGCCQPTNVVWCSGHDEKKPWRKVEKYIARKSHYVDEGKRYYWTVALSCGHCYSPISADEEWSPGMPPHVDSQQTAQMVEKSERTGEHIETAQWMREQIEHNGFMICTPAMEAECPKCAYLRRIVEYRPIGRLSDEPYRPPEQEPKRQPTAEEIKAAKLAELAKVEASMKRMEAKAARLRRETE